MENLNKQQLVLLTILVSFVTSIATGITTVSLLDHTAPSINQTINRVVEKTIETVIPVSVEVPKEVIKEVPKEVKQMADTINKELTAIEETLYQTKAKSGQDVLNYPIKLNDKLAGLFDVASSGNFAPSKQAKEVYADLAAQIDIQIAKLNSIKQKEIPALNELIREKALPVIGVK